MLPMCDGVASPHCINGLRGLEFIYIYKRTHKKVTPKETKSRARHSLTWRAVALLK